MFPPIPNHPPVSVKLVFDQIGRMQRFLELPEVQARKLDASSEPSLVLRKASFAHALFSGASGEGVCAELALEEVDLEVRPGQVLVISGD